MSEHTPTLVQVEPYPCRIGDGSITLWEGVAATPEQTAEVVRAVNAYPRLVEAVQKARDAIASNSGHTVWQTGLQEYLDDLLKELKI